jgi:predicted site-specific integrase-resolvase
METTPQMLTERQVARALAVSTAALRRWRREGRGPEFAHVERCVRYPVQAIERFLTENSSANKKAADGKSAAQREVRVADATTHV